MSPHATGWSLRTRFRLLIAFLLLAGGAIGFGGFMFYSQDVFHTLSGWFAERNVLYEKSRVIQLLSREIVLVQKMAHTPALIRWAHDEQDPQSRDRAIQEMEGFRTFFSDRSFFMVLAGSGHYYFSDQASHADAATPRYTLDPAIPKDAWFFLTLAQVPDYQLNVDTDRHLKQTKIWINAVMRDAGEPLAVLGTGLDLTRFLDRIVHSDKEGVINMLLDRDGAIQAHRDVTAIDFASIRKPLTGERRNTLYGSLDDPGEVAALHTALATVEQGEETHTLDLTIEGRHYIAAVAYLPEIKWFLVTLTNPAFALDHRILLTVGIVFLLTLAGTLLVTGYLFDRAVLHPLSLLDGASRRLANGDYQVALPAGRPGELGHLAATFGDMARRIRDHTRDLERQVAERTRELEQLAYTDLLTGHLNRRGLYDRLKGTYKRLERHAGRLGFILLDIDHFKRCNDTYGHDAGDRALVHIAGIVRENLRGYDLCARWGGEEFLVVVDDMTSEPDLVAVAEKLRLQVKQRPLVEGETVIRLTASLGTCLAGRDESIDSVITRVDEALYRAKDAGRDRVATAPTPESDGDSRSAA